MDTLDSRSLRYTNCFAQKFNAPGRNRYRVTTGSGFCPPSDEDDLIIQVGRRKQAGGKGRQVTLSVRREGSRLVVDQPNLEIESGDTVLWNAPDASTPGFSVQGEGPDGSFSSFALSREAVFTHAFGAPGTYEWVDANGSGVKGVVTVRSMDASRREDCEKWLASLSKGALFLIEGDKVSPVRHEVLAGQTVFWAVQKAPGITITDVRLVPGMSKPQPPAPPTKGGGKVAGTSRGRGRPKR
jgi:plastocyanin